MAVGSPRYRRHRPRALLSVRAPMALILLLGCGPDFLGEGNRYMDGTVTVRALDATTKGRVDPFQVKLIYSDRNKDPEFGEVRSTGSGGSTTFTISYPTLNYRLSGLRDGFAFFDEDMRYVLEVSADGYRTASLPFPKYIAHGRRFPPAVLPPITVELKRKTADERAADRDLSGWDPLRKEYATTFDDGKLSSDKRLHAGYCLTRCPPPHPEEIISLVARGLDHDDPQFQLYSAWILGEIASDAPTKFDIWYGGDRGLFWEKYRANVPLFQRWWKLRRENKR